MLNIFHWSAAAAIDQCILTVAGTVVFQMWSKCAHKSSLYPSSTYSRIPFFFYLVPVLRNHFYHWLHHLSCKILAGAAAGRRGQPCTCIYWCRHPPRTVTSKSPLPTHSVWAVSWETTKQDSRIVLLGIKCMHVEGIDYSSSVVQQSKTQGRLLKLLAFSIQERQCL